MFPIFIKNVLFRVKNNFIFTFSSLNMCEHFQYEVRLNKIIVNCLYKQCWISWLQVRK